MGVLDVLHSSQQKLRWVYFIAPLIGQRLRSDEAAPITTATADLHLSRPLDIAVYSTQCTLG